LTAERIICTAATDTAADDDAVSASRRPDEAGDRHTIMRHESVREPGDHWSGVRDCRVSQLRVLFGKCTENEPQQQEKAVAGGCKK
jgi:hypothetical protein